MTKLYAKENGEFKIVDEISGEIKINDFKKLITDKFEAGDNIEITFKDSETPIIINLIN